MGHTYNIVCNNCNVKFCDCHKAVYARAKNDELLTFCDVGCFEEYRDFWNKNAKPKDRTWQVKEGTEEIP